MEKKIFIKEIKYLCIGEKIPDPVLVSTGMFPKGWVDLYLSLLAENRIYWQNLDSWPRELFYCFFRVGIHVNQAYSEWCRISGEQNSKTEKELAKIQLFTDAFVGGDVSLKWNLSD